MAAPAFSSNRRRLRWALLIALALHGLLAWRYAPQLFERLETLRSAVVAAPAEQALEIAPLPPPPKSRGFVLATQLAGGSPEQLPPELPPGFFRRPEPLASGSLHISDDLALARRRGAALVANIIPAAARLPNITAISDRPRAPLLKAERPVPAAGADTAQIPQQVPFLLAPAAPDADVDAALAEAARDAERKVRVANSAATRPAPDYRALLLQGPLVTDAPRPQQSSSITTFALDTPAAPGSSRAAPDEGKRVAAARQQFFSQLTARLKTANQRLLAEAVKAGPRAVVRMRFLLGRQGQVIEVGPAEPGDAALARRAAAVIRAATLPPVPAEMTEVPLELSFPVEVYR